MSWETEFDVNRLSKIEAVYELKLRGVSTNENDSSDTIRKLLRKVIKEKTLNVACASEDQLLQELENIKTAFEEQEELLDATNLDINISQIVSKFSHYKNRLNVLRDKDGKDFTSSVKENLLDKIEEIGQKLDVVYKAYQEEQNNRVALQSGNDNTLPNILSNSEDVSQSQNSQSQLTNTSSLGNSSGGMNPPQVSMIQTDINHMNYNLIQTIPRVDQVNPRSTETNLSLDQPIFRIYQENPTSSQIYSSVGQRNSGSGQINTLVNSGVQIKVKTPTITPPNFDGKSDIEEFIRDYTLACSLNQWPDQLKIHYLPLYLKGSAKVLCENEIMNKQFNTWTEIETIFRNFYTPVGNEDRIEWEMLSRKQKPTESAEEYFQEKIRLINKFDPHMVEDRKVKLLLYGLLPDIIAKIICMGNNNTIQELRENIRKTDLANYMVNVSVKGFERFQIDNQCTAGAMWSGTVNNIDRSQDSQGNNKVNYSQNEVLFKEIANLKGEIENLKINPTRQYNAPRYNQHNPRYQKSSPHTQRP